MNEAIMRRWHFTKQTVVESPDIDAFLKDIELVSGSGMRTNQQTKNRKADTCER